MAKSIHLQWPISNVKCIDAHKRRQKSIELRSWSNLPSKGKSVLQFADDRYGNCWLYNPSLLKPSRYLTALRVRSGTTSDDEQGHPPGDTKVSEMQELCRNTSAHTRVMHLCKVKQNRNTR